jgi:hypothetical protein
MNMFSIDDVCIVARGNRAMQTIFDAVNSQITE